MNDHRLDHLTGKPPGSVDHGKALSLGLASK